LTHVAQLGLSGASEQHVFNPLDQGYIAMCL
jgi:hypothetical protein